MRRATVCAILAAATAVATTLAGCASKSSSPSNSTASSGTQNSTATPGSSVPAPAPSPSPAGSSTTTTTTGGTTSGAALTVLTAAQLEGTWAQTSCAPAGTTTSARDTVRFSGTTGQYTDTRQYYVDTTCTTAATQLQGGVLNMSGTYAIVAASTLPTAANVQYAPTGTTFMTLNITSLTTDYGSGTAASTALANYQSQGGCKTATLSGSVLNVTSCFPSLAGSAVYQYLLPSASGSILDIGQVAVIAAGCSASAGAAKGACTVDQLANAAASFQKQ